VFLIDSVCDSLFHSPLNFFSSKEADSVKQSICLCTQNIEVKRIAAINRKSDTVTNTVQSVGVLEAASLSPATF
jgi:hypothetical protein